MEHYEEVILAPVRRAGKGFYALVLVLLLIIAWAIFSYVSQFTRGLGITGMSKPIYWGVYITNFVFFIGLSHAGTLISAILRIVNAKWRLPFTRAAEAVTVFSLPFGVGSILMDLGRPDRVLNLIRYGQFQSPLLWDVTAVSAYLTSSVIFFYVAMIPDIALMRDRLTEVSPVRKKLYAALALGWRDTPEQHHRLERIMGAMAIFLTLLVVIVHTVVSWVFGMTIQPGWHTTIIGPYFLVGAIFSGVAAVTIVAAILRQLFRFQEFLTPRHFDYLGKFLLALTLAWFYFTFAEYLTTVYGGETSHMRVFLSKFSQEFGPLFYAMFLFCFFIPLPILALNRTRTILGVVIASISINIGMWLERFTVIVPSLSRPRIPYEWGAYTPTSIEWSIMLGCFAGLILLYAIFTKLFPVISIWEIAEEAEEHTPQPAVEGRLVKEAGSGQ